MGGEKRCQNLTSWIHNENFATSRLNVETLLTVSEDDSVNLNLCGSGQELERILSRTRLQVLQMLLSFFDEGTFFSCNT
jgi:hypothetical protein